MYHAADWEAFVSPLLHLYQPNYNAPVSTFVEPSHLEFTPVPASARGLRGYFQSSRYFAPYVAELRELFVLHPVLVEWASAAHPEVLAAVAMPWLSVALHVRRGDYRQSAEHDVIREPYWTRAIAHMRARVPESKFYIFTDDEQWVTEQPVFAGMHIVRERDGPRTLWLMSRFKRFIMANSSFSWWAVALANATDVVAPARWYNTGRDTHIYEPHWVLLEPA